MTAMLRVCPGCSRHVRVSEPACPFCGREFDDVSRAVASPRPPALRRLGRAAMFALSACSASLGGGTNAPPASDTANPIGSGTHDAGLRHSADAGESEYSEIPAYGASFPP